MVGGGWWVVGGGWWVVAGGVGGGWWVVGWWVVGGGCGWRVVCGGGAEQGCGQNPSIGIRSPPGPADAHDARSMGEKVCGWLLGLGGWVGGWPPGCLCAWVGGWVAG